MATDGPLLTKISVLAAKAETTTGTIVAVTDTDAAMNVLNLDLKPDEQTNERQIQAALGQLASIPGADSGTLTFRTEISGSGASGLPLWATVLLPACNMENTAGTFDFTRGVTTLTMVHYTDGTKRTLYGARGTFKITIEYGKPAYIDWTFKGCYQEEADASILAPTFPTVIPPVCKALTWTFGSGYTPRASKIEIDAGLDVQMREDLNAASGYHGAAIVDMKPTGTIDPEMVLVATKDWAALRTASTEQAFSVAIGSASNNTVTITSAAAQVKNKPHGDRHGLATMELGIQFNSATPFSIAFT